MSEAKYPSKYTDKLITDGQFLTERICERIAAKEKKTLVYQFWSKSPEWGKIFRRQIKDANELLAEASLVEIMTALRSKDGQKIYSLGAKKQILNMIRAQSASFVPNDVAVEVMSDLINSLEDTFVEESIKSAKQKKLWNQLG